jgi:Fe-S-cluster containining protein
VAKKIWGYAGPIAYCESPRCVIQSEKLFNSALFKGTHIINNSVTSITDTCIVRGFVIESGGIIPVEVTVENLTTDCCDVLLNGQSICWHKKYNDVFLDLCISCDSVCKAYSENNRPAFGKLVELEKLNQDDAIRFNQNSASAGAKLRKVYEKTPSTVCSNCGDCCRSFSIDLYSVEYQQILRYLKRYFSISDLNRIRGLCGMEVAIEQRGLAKMRRCPFRNEESKLCTINEVKPIVCRQYKCEKIEWADSSGCSGKKKSREMISSFSDPFFIVRDKEILIFRTNELNRWFLL